MEYVIAIIGIIVSAIVSIIVIYLNYRNQIRTQQQNEIYVRKLDYYKDLIEIMGEIVSSMDDKNWGVKFRLLYFKSAIFSSDKVIGLLNDFYQLYKSLARSEGTYKLTVYEDIYGKLLKAFREDLKIQTELGEKDLTAPFK